MTQNRTPQILMIPQYRTLKLKLPQYRMEKSPISQYRKPPFNEFKLNVHVYMKLENNASE